MRLFFIFNGLIILILTCLAAFTSQAAAQAAVTVSVIPDDITLAPQATHTIEIWANEVTNLVAFDVEVHYDPARLTVSSLALGDFLDPGFPAPNAGIDAEQGTLRYGMAQLSASTPKSGSGCLFSFQILVNDLPGGSTAIDIEQAFLVDKDYFSIAHTLLSGIVHIEGSRLFLPVVLFLTEPD